MQYTEMVKRRYFKLLSLKSSNRLKAGCGSHSSRCAHRSIPAKTSFSINWVEGLMRQVQRNQNNSIDSQIICSRIPETHFT
jgi:hypothetical protein